MNTWRRKALLGVVCLGLLWGGGWAWSNRAEIAEAVRCRASCATLAPEQLRLQVIKAYLHRQLEGNIERHDMGGNYQLALVPRSLTAQDMAQGIRDASLLATVTMGATILGSHAQIDALDVDALAQDPSIAVYSLHHRYLDITPTRSIQKASAIEVENYFRIHSRDGATPSFSSLERWRGYGPQFFWLTRWHADLACCDGRGDSGGASLYQKNKSSLVNIGSVRPWLMAVSNRGAILVRTYDDQEFIVF